MDSLNTSKILSLVGLARRAGKTVIGTDLVITAVKAGKASIVLIASDVSERTEKQLCDKCFSHNVKLVSLSATREAMAKAAGKSSPISAVAVTDRNFTAGIVKLLQAE